MEIGISNVVASYTSATRAIFPCFVGDFTFDIKSITTTQTPPPSVGNRIFQFPNVNVNGLENPEILVVLYSSITPLEH